MYDLIMCTAAMITVILIWRKLFTIYQTNSMRELQNQWERGECIECGKPVTDLIDTTCEPCQEDLLSKVGKRW